jgi:hypothetical protein
VTDNKTLRIERTFQAPAEAVFDADPLPNLRRPH